jgi:hypothetical protein
MATAPLRVSAPQSPYRDCDIAVVEPADPASPPRVICTDAETGLIIGSPSILPDCRDGRQDVNAEEVIQRIGGAYRLASIAVEIGTEELARLTRAISDELRVRRRLWRRRKRARTTRRLDACRSQPLA